jgi:23S rRNA (cytidine1920-2'-O)/16S rRNA (cytidine1409-2'-O)-methyltransferase
VRRRLDTELVRRGLVDSRARAVDAIRSGRVLVGGARAETPARQVGDDEAIRIDGPAARYVSRGGDKLAAALARFAVRVEGVRALDAGASTGGFTDCLLQHGAAHVEAVDVGRGQLAWSLRTDARVTVRERCNVRNLTAADLGGEVDLAVADLSFISLLTVAPALAACTSTTGSLVLLVKPQFEAGRDRVGRGGIVRDPAVHTDVLTRVATGLAAGGLPVVDVLRSPIRGADGNVEFLVHCQKGAVPVAVAALVAATRPDPVPVPGPDE